MLSSQGGYLERSQSDIEAATQQEAHVTRIAHILVATDLTERSELAFRRALQLQQQVGATLILLHVIEPGLMGDLAAHRRRDAEVFLRERVAKLPENVQRRCPRKVAVGDAFSTICCEAQAQGAGLIVLGEPGKYRYADLFIGTTAERVVRASPIPVLIVKATTLGPYRRVLVPLDLSEAAMRALAITLTIAPTAELRIVHAWRPPLASLSRRHAALPDTIRKENEEIKALIERVVEETRADLAAQRRVLNVDMIEDNPYVVLRSESNWPDLLAMGTHSTGGVATDKVGNLARHMLAEAPCDVLVARP
jgi:nucleotide-binding universal stress UspA family protein